MENESEEKEYTWPCSNFFRAESFVRNFLLASGGPLFSANTNGTVVTQKEIAELENSYKFAIGKSYEGSPWYNDAIITEFLGRLQEWDVKKRFTFSIEFLFLDGMVAIGEQKYEQNSAETQKSMQRKFLSLKENKRRDIANVRYHFVPIHETDHWVLVVLDFHQEKILWFDSENKKHTLEKFEKSLLPTIRAFVNLFHKEAHWELETLFTKHELNLRNEGLLCGPFVCLVAQWFATDSAGKHEFRQDITNKTVYRFAEYMLYTFKKLSQNFPFEPFLF